ncbi:hypothetical protein KI387_027204, partial [Taxus chinensis]
HPSIEEEIRLSWKVVKGKPMFKLVEKLKNVKARLKVWNKETFGNIFAHKTEISEVLKKLEDDIYFWDIIHKDVEESIQDFFSYGKLLKEVNSTFITLVPKVSGPKKVTNFRPI